MNVKLSQNAVASVAAVLAHDPKVREEGEERYHEAYKTSILKPEGHVQSAPPDNEANTSRLYTVTTIASSARYGGTRTPMICTTFERAKEAVESNHGDIYECSYRFAVIEAVIPDRLYGTDLNERYWYKWVFSPVQESTGHVLEGHEGSYQAIEEPAAFAGMVTHGLG